MSNEIASAPNQYPLLAGCGTWSCSRTWSSPALFVGRPKSIKAWKSQWKRARAILLVRQRIRRPRTNTRRGLVQDRLHFETSLRCSSSPDGTVKVLVEGSQRARIQSNRRYAQSLRGRSRRRAADAGEFTEIEACRRAADRPVRPVREVNKKIPP